MFAGSRGKDEEVSHRCEEHIGRADQKGGNIVGFDAKRIAIGIEPLDGFEDDADEIAGHRIQRYLRA